MTSMNPSIQAAAQAILATLQRSYQGDPGLVPAQPEEFGHLDLRAYQDHLQQLERWRFTHLADLELLSASQSPTTVLARTFIRSAVYQEGAMVSEYYQIRPRLGRLARQLGRGLRNGRLLAAPQFFVRTLPTRHCHGFETEFSDGSFLTTSNAAAAAMIALPPSVAAEFLPQATPLKPVFLRHRERVKQRLHQQPGLRWTAVRSADDLLAMQRRLQTVKAAHREALNWVTREEIGQMTGQQHPELAEAVFQEVTHLLQQNRPQP